MEIMQILISSFLGGILHLDNAQVGQFFISRPSFLGVLIGVLNGCPVQGAIMGILIELVYSDFLPLGGAVPPSGLVAAIVSVLLYAHFFKSMSLAFFIGVFAGFLYSKVEFALRKRRSEWNIKMEDEIRENRFKINHWIAKALIEENMAASFFIMAFTFVFVFFGKFFCFPLLFKTTDLAFSLVPWIVLSGLILKFKKQLGARKSISAKERK